MIETNNNELFNTITFDLPINIKDTYVGIYKQRVVGEDGKIYDAIKIGLFKKDRNYKIEQSKKPIQSYKDILTGNAIGLLQYEDGHDITTSSEYVPDIMKKYEPLSPDYGVDYYSSIMDAIQKDYGIEPFNSLVIGKGLVNLERFAPDLKNNLSLKTILEVLMTYNKLSALVDTKIAEPITQKSILNSIAAVSSNAQKSNETDLYKLSEEFNTNKVR